MDNNLRICYENTKKKIADLEMRLMQMDKLPNAQTVTKTKEDIYEHLAGLYKVYFDIAVKIYK